MLESGRVAARSPTPPQSGGVMPGERGKGPVYGRILDVVRRIPYGQVATYGQVALIAGGCTPRMVGYCLASLDNDSDVPWQRVINYKGGISPRSTGHGSELQRLLLQDEGVEFDEMGRVSFRRFGWMED